MTTSPAPPAQASPESLDQVIETTKSQGWAALWAIAIGIVIVIAWACIADIPQQNSASGVVSALKYSRDVAAPVTGILDLNENMSPRADAGTSLGTVMPYDGSSPVDITLPSDSRIAAVYVTDGEGVVAGQTLATATIQPDLTEGILVATYVPASEALTYFPDQAVQVTVTNLESSQTVVVNGTIEHVSDTPSSLVAMTNMSGSESQAEKWNTGADGMPFQVLMTLKDWPSEEVAIAPASGQVVSIVHTYGTVHPIQLLFGGK